MYFLNHSWLRQVGYVSGSAPNSFFSKPVNVKYNRARAIERSRERGREGHGEREVDAVGEDSIFLIVFLLHCCAFKYFCELSVRWHFCHLPCSSTNFLLLWTIVYTVSKYTTPCEKVLLVAIWALVWLRRFWIRYPRSKWLWKRVRVPSKPLNSILNSNASLLFLF